MYSIGTKSFNANNMDLEEATTCAVFEEDFNGFIEETHDEDETKIHH